MQDKQYYTGVQQLRNNRYNKRGVREWITFSLDPTFTSLRWQGETYEELHAV
jgi:hypothetical protein